LSANQATLIEPRYGVK